jgi:hypothetical protein
VIAEVLAIVGSHRIDTPTAAVKPTPASLNTGTVGEAAKPESAQPAAAAVKTDEKTTDGVATAPAKPIAETGTPVIAAPEKSVKPAPSDAVSAKPAGSSQ